MFESHVGMGSRRDLCTVNVKLMSVVENLCTVSPSVTQQSHFGRSGASGMLHKSKVCIQMSHEYSQIPI